MNFQEALAAMRENKTVKRKESEALYYKTESMFRKNEEDFSYIVDRMWQGSTWIFSVEDFEANDWEVVE